MTFGEEKGEKWVEMENFREEGTESDCLLQTDRLMDIHFIFIDRLSKVKIDLACDALCSFLRKCLSISCHTSRSDGDVSSCPLSDVSSPGWMYSCRSNPKLVIPLIQKSYSFNPRVLFLSSKNLIPLIQKFE